MDPLLPNIDLDFNASWYWFHDRLGLSHEDLFTTLYDRFDTKKFPLQDPVSFHRDVRECADAADTQDEFYSKLAERMNERIEQMTEAWEDITTWLSAFPQNMFCQLCYDEETFEVKLKLNSLNDGPVERSDAFDKFARTMSFDSMVEFFDGFARDERKRQQDEERRQMESRKCFERGRAAERLAAPCRTPDPASPDPAFHHSRESSRDAPTMVLPFPGTFTSDTPKSTGPLGHRSPDQPEVSAQARTATSLTRKRSDEGDEGDEGDENAQGPKEKKQRLMSAGEGDAERCVGKENQRVAEASPTLEQTKKRKRADEVDDLQKNARRKQPRIMDDPVPRFTQLLERAATELNESTQDITTSEATSLFPTTAPYCDNPDMTDEECDQTTLRRLDSNSFISSDSSQSFTTAPLSLNEDVENRYGLMAKNSTISASTRGPDREPQPSRRQRKRQPRGEQRTPTPKKQTCRRKPREQNASPLVQQILQSKRSSRRGPAQKLLFLDDNGTTCATAIKKRN
ncbi:hypothetical protein ACQKWADRAFT_160001 [Trichoderma austrokoningii]